MTTPRTARLTCRSCGATPDQRGDQVSPAAFDYTCSTCLCTGGMASRTPVTTRGQFRSITHGTCGLNGVHTPGPEVEAECPLRSRQDRAAARRAIRESKTAAATPAQRAARAAGAERLRRARQKAAQPVLA